MLINIRPKGKCRYKTKITLKHKTRDFLVVQWLGLHSTAGGTGSILAQGTKIPQATRCGQKTKTKKLSGLQYQVADIAYLPGCDESHFVNVRNL